MRNLKKILALVLALAMAFSLVASAASFPDVEPTSATGQAVDLLTGLNIVGGYPDGTFGPEKEITRAEFLKMLFITLNGKDDDGLFGGNSDKFPDVTSDKWFAPYVNWGVQLGIIGGYPDGTFKPDNNVTVAEAAKMIVTALGFDALDYSFPYGFIDKGIQLGIFENVSGIGADDSALRGNIAIMNYNMLFVTSAPRYGTYIPNTGWVYVTPIEKVFGAQKVETEVVATSTNMPGLADLTDEGKVAVKANTDAENGTSIVAGAYDFTGADALVGHLVEVWFINAKGDNGTAMGDKKDDRIVAMTDVTDQSLVVAASALTTSSAGSGDIKDGDAYATIDGVDTMLFAAVRDLNGSKTTDSNGDVKRYFWNDGVNNNKNWVLNGGASDPAFQVYPRSYNQNTVVFTSSIAGAYTFVDYDLSTNDRTTDAWDHVYVNYWRTGEVTNVTSANITINGINRNTAIPLKQIKGDISSLVKGDYVNVSVTTGIVDDEVKDIYTIEKAEVLKDAVIEARTNRGVRINGSLYLFSFFNGFENASDAHTNVKVGEKYDIVLDKGGYIYFYETPDVLPNYMLITNVAADKQSIMGAEYTVYGKLSDGTDASFKLDEDITKITIGGKVIFDTSVDADTGWTNVDGDAAAGKASIGAIGKLVQFTTNSEGKIDSMTDPKRTIDTTDATYNYDAASKLLYKKTDDNPTPVIDKKVADNTVFFIYDEGQKDTYTDDKFVVYTGADMRSFDNTTLALLNTQENDANTAEAVLITGDIGAVNGYNMKLAYGTYDRGIVVNPENANEKAFEFKLFVDGQAGTYRTPYFDVSSAKTVAEECKIISKEVTGVEITNPPVVNGMPSYIELNENNEIIHIYTTRIAKSGGGYEYDGVKLDIDKPMSANETIGWKATNVYRAAITDVNTDNNTITFGKVNAQGRASKVEQLPPTSENGVITDHYIYSYEKFVTLPVADDVMIQVINGTFSAYQNSTVSAGTLSDLLESSDGGYSYVADFVVAHKNNNTAEPLEVTQLTFFKYAIGNSVDQKSEGKDNTVLTSFMGVQMNVDGSLPEDATFTVDYNVDTFTQALGNPTTLVSTSKATIADTALTAGQENNVTVKVTSQSGKTKDYTFKVYRANQVKPNGSNLNITVKKADINGSNGALFAHTAIWEQLTAKDDAYKNTFTTTLKTTSPVTSTQGKSVALVRSSAGINVKCGTADIAAGDTFDITVNLYVNLLGNNAQTLMGEQTITVTVEA